VLKKLSSSLSLLLLLFPMNVGSRRRHICTMVVSKGTMMMVLSMMVVRMMMVILQRYRIVFRMVAKCSSSLCISKVSAITGSWG